MMRRRNSPSAKVIKNTNKILVIIDLQKAFIKRNNLPVKLVKQLKILVIGNQMVLCSKQKEVTDYFKSIDSPN